MIAERIYRGETAEQIGIPERAYRSRRDTLDRYLQHSGGTFDKDGYLAWLKTDEAGKPSDEDPVEIDLVRIVKAGSAGGCGVCGQRKPPSAGQMARSLAKELARFARSGFKTVRDYHKRLAVCEACAEFTDSRRCRVCGCFMDAKARMATTDCPLARWPQEPDEKTEVV